MGGERGDAGFSATSKSGSTSLFNIGWLVAVLEVGAHGKGDNPVMTGRTVVMLGAAAITIEDKRAKDTPDTSQEIVVFLCTILSPRYLISSLSRADPPGSGFNNTNFSLLLCPENPENTANGSGKIRSEEHTSELQSQSNLVCRLLLEKKKKKSCITRKLCLSVNSTD